VSLAVRLEPDNGNREASACHHLCATGRGGGVIRLVFVGPLGGRVRRSNFRDIWTEARDAVCLPDLYLHDLRHTGNTLAAATGASLRDLMERMGHSSTRAAMIYQHATRERDEAIVAAMGEALAQVRRAADKSQSGTRRARKRGTAS
jgi:integrase